MVWMVRTNSMPDISWQRNEKVTINEFSVDEKEVRGGNECTSK